MNNISHDPDITSAGATAPRPLLRLAYSVAEAAAVTGLGRTTLYGLIAQGALPSRKIGKRRIIRGADLEALIGSPCDQAA